MSKKEEFARKRPATAYIAIIIMAAAITAVLGALGSIAFPFLAPISSFYPGVAFQVAFGLWFGIWGAIGGGWLGPFIGVVLTGTPAPLGAAIAMGDFVQAFIPMVAFRALKFDTELKTKRDWTGHIVFNVLIAQAAGATIGAGSLAAAGIFPWSVFPIAWLGWFVSNVVVVAIITTILMKVFSAYLKKTALYVPGYAN
jgi:integral membrane sensor domain MASE1